MRLLDNIHRIDLSTLSWLLRYKHRERVITISRFVSISADGPLYFLMGFFFLFLGYRDFALLTVMAFAIERTCYKVFKGTFKRHRPPDAIPGFKSVVVPSDQFSFPSGHTSAAFLTACTYGYFFPLSLMLLLPWACAVGVARVVLGVHFPSDIVAGALMGSSICLLCISFLF